VDVERIIEISTRPLLLTGLLCLLIAFGLRRLQPRLRRWSLKWLIGDAVDEWPELESLLLPVCLRNWSFVTRETLFNDVLVRRPSKVTRALLEAYGVRMREAKLDLEESLVDDMVITQEALILALRACFFVRGSRPGMTKVDSSELLVAMFGEPAFANVLREAGLSKLKVTYFLSHGMPLPDDESVAADLAAGPVWIRLHNDHYSSMELVTQILRDVFVLDEAAATLTMQQIHRVGYALLGPFAPDVTMDRLKKATVLARAVEAPLMLSVTTEGADEGAHLANLHDTSCEPRNPYAPPSSVASRSAGA
jgi:ATP-dependent Clp protease adapter protein ClpS